MFTAEQVTKLQSLVAEVQLRLEELVEVGLRAKEAILTDMDLHDKLTAEGAVLFERVKQAQQAVADYRNSVVTGTEE